MKALHGFLSSPTGGGVRHGATADTELPVHESSAASYSLTLPLAALKGAGCLCGLLQRYCCCGWSNSLSIVLIGEQGTPASLSFATQCSTGSRVVIASMAMTIAGRLLHRRSLLMKRGSSANAGDPSASAINMKSVSLPAAMMNLPAIA